MNASFICTIRSSPSVTTTRSSRELNVSSSRRRWLQDLVEQLDVLDRRRQLPRQFVREVGALVFVELAGERSVDHECAEGAAPAAQRAPAGPGRRAPARTPAGRAASRARPARADRRSRRRRPSAQTRDPRKPSAPAAGPGADAARPRSGSPRAGCWRRRPGSGGRLPGSATTRRRARRRWSGREGAGGSQAAGRAQAASGRCGLPVRNRAGLVLEALTIRVRGILRC